MTKKNMRATQALDLLGDILEDTEELARQEEEQLAEQLRQREEEARLKAEAEAKRRAEEADRRMAEEEARRREAAERRSMAERAMQAVDEPEEEKVAAAPVVAAPEPEKSSPLIPLLAALVIGAIAVGGFFGYQAMTKEFVDGETVYTASSPAVQVLAANTAEYQVAVLLKPKEEAAAEEERRRAPSRRSSSSRPSTPAPSGLRLGGGISGRN